MDTNHNPQEKELTRLEKVEYQLKVMNTELSRISAALVGDSYTVGGGVINRLQKMETDLKEIGDEVAILKDNMKFIKWLGALLATSILGGSIWIFKK